MIIFGDMLSFCMRFLMAAGERFDFFLDVALNEMRLPLLVRKLILLFLPAMG